MFNFLNKLPESVKLTVNSSLPLVVVLILFLVAGNFGISKVLDLQSQISKAQSDQTILRNKLNVLQTVTAEVSTGSNVAVAALPDSNPSLLVVSQLRTVASENGLVVSNIKTSGEVKESSGLSRVDISFNVDGPKAQVFAFLQAITKIAPITLIDKVKVTESTGSARATTSVKSYWASFPKTLPTLTQSISALTNSEKAVLTKISDLRQPNFVDVPASNGPGKTDPFGQ